MIIEYTPSSQDVVDSTPPMKSEGGCVLTDGEEGVSALALVEFSPPESSLSSGSDANTIASLIFRSTDSENFDVGSVEYLERVTKQRQKSINAFFAKKSKRIKINKKKNKTNLKVRFSDVVEVHDVPKKVTPEKDYNLFFTYLGFFTST